MKSLFDLDDGSELCPAESDEPQQSIALQPEPYTWTSQFELINTRALNLRYRLLRVENLPNSDDLDRLLNKLAKTINYELRQPVVLLRKEDVPYLAIPQEAPSPAQPEYGIGPHIARLVSAAENLRLDLSALDNEEDIAIAVKFLEAAFRAPLLRRNDLWRVGGNGFYTKDARNEADRAAEVDIYPGFIYSVTEEEGRFFLSVDVNVRCIDRKFLTERVAQGDGRDFKRKHCLYQLGHRWYMVQFWGMTGCSIQKQRFCREGETRTWDIHGYTLAECRKQVQNGSLPPCIAQLNPESAAIIYRYPGNEVERYGALALCRLARATSDREVARLHKETLFDPTPRMELVNQMVRAYFQRATLSGQELRLSTEPFHAPRHTFAIPDQVFGNNYVLRVAPQCEEADDRAAIPLNGTTSQTCENGTTIEVVSLECMGRRRLELMCDAKIGPLTRTPFDTQYLLVPKEFSAGDRRGYRIALPIRDAPGFRQSNLHHDAHCVR